MGLAAQLTTDEGRRALTSTLASTLLHGAVRTSVEQGGWRRPWRVTAAQLRALTSTSALRPGLFRQMASTSAGITLEFETDATEIALELRMDYELSGSAVVLSLIDELEGVPRRRHDGVTADVDGRHVGPLLPVDAAPGLWVIELSLDDVARADDTAGTKPAGTGEADTNEQAAANTTDELPPSANNSTELPLFGERTLHRVKIWLPCLRGCMIRELFCNGSFIQPLSTRPQLLVIGDSIAQGFVADDPAHAWPSRIATASDLDLLNQGIGGQIFQAGSLRDLAHVARPACVVVALGENYRYEPIAAREAAMAANDLLAEVAARWPEVHTVVLSPTYYHPGVRLYDPDNCCDELPSILQKAAQRYPQMVFVDGSLLLDADPALIADAVDHPNAAGHAQIAERLQPFLPDFDPLRPASRTSTVRKRRKTTKQEQLPLKLSRERRNAGQADPPRETSLSDGLGPFLRREKALQVLSTLAPGDAIPLAEVIKREICEVRYASDDAIFVDNPDEKCQILWARDKAQALRIAAELIDTSYGVSVCGDAAMQAVQDVCDFELGELYYICWHGGGMPDEPKGRTIRPLSILYLDEVIAHYSHPEFFDRSEYERRLLAGKILGGFDDKTGRLVGYIGEHEDGAIGMLEVFEEYRGQGWAQALETAKTREHLQNGYLPWGQVFADNSASLALQNKMGSCISATPNYCFAGPFSCKS